MHLAQKTNRDPSPKLQEESKTSISCQATVRALLGRQAKNISMLALFASVLFVSAWLTVYGVRNVLQPHLGDWLSIPLALAMLAWFSQRMTHFWLHLTNR
jgi:hypothetical protein